MALLLKIKQTMFQRGIATVPTQKSVKDIGQSDINSIVYVWFADSQELGGALFGRYLLENAETISMPMQRNPDAQKPGYRLTLRQTAGVLHDPLSTNDLAAFRNSSGNMALDRLGRLHKDRNDKVFRLSTDENAFLAARFSDQP